MGGQAGGCEVEVPQEATWQPVRANKATQQPVRANN
jgi:hypothetical protein